MREIPSDFKIISGAIPSSTPPSIKKIAETLDKMKPKYLVKSRELASIAGISINTLHRYSQHPALKDYCYKINPTFTLWGSKRTIAELRRKIRDPHRPA